MVYGCGDCVVFGHDVLMYFLWLVDTMLLNMRALSVPWVTAPISHCYAPTSMFITCVVGCGDDLVVVNNLSYHCDCCRFAPIERNSVHQHNDLFSIWCDLQLGPKNMWHSRQFKWACNKALFLTLWMCYGLQTPHCATKVCYDMMACMALCMFAGYCSCLNPVQLRTVWPRHQCTTTTPR